MLSLYHIIEFNFHGKWLGQSMPLPPPHWPMDSLQSQCNVWLTCFWCGGALFTDSSPTAHCGAGSQVELVPANRLQVTQDPLGGVRIADFHCLQWSHLLCVINYTQKGIGLYVAYTWGSFRKGERKGEREELSLIKSIIWLIISND